MSEPLTTTRGFGGAHGDVECKAVPANGAPGAATASIALSSRVVIAGAARNCAVHLPQVLGSIARLNGCFKSAAHVFIENDSADKTVEIISKWAASQPDAQLMHPETDLRLVKRTIRIAACRNAILDVVRASYPDYDFLIMLDMDEPNYNLNADEVVAAVDYLQSHPNIAGVFANSDPIYYDLWALRHPVWCPGDCWAEARAHAGALGSNLAVRIFVGGRMLRINPEAPPFPVISAFGGLGIYKLGDALQGRYEGTDAEGRSICEHVPFHLSVTANTKRTFKILPSLLVQAPAAHVDRLNGTPINYIRNIVKLMRDRWTEDRTRF